jgi:GNAT superfamily N-acetyltransferase
MAGYRFCRTDDLPLLVEAYNACWLPHFAANRPLDLDACKRDVRELNLWASSCMVAMADDELIGVLLGAKRDDGSLVHRIAIKAGHTRQGHGRHLLDSLRRKVAILGPPRLLVEIPAEWTAVRRFVEQAGFAAEARYADFVTDRELAPAGPAGGLVSDATFEELLESSPDLAGAARRSWQRSLQTLRNRSADLAGLAIASDARVEAYLLHRDGPDDTEIVAFGGPHPELLPALVAVLYERRGGRLRLPRVSEDEIAFALLGELGFRAVGEYIGYAADFSDL